MALATLREAPALTALTLHAGANPLGDRGAAALALLRGAPALQALTLAAGDASGPGSAAL